MLNIALYKAPLVWIGIFGIFALCGKAASKQKLDTDD